MKFLRCLLALLTLSILGLPLPVMADVSVPTYLESSTNLTRQGVGVSCISGCTAGGSITIISSVAAEACHVLKASAGDLYDVSGAIGAAGWIMVFNATSAPADGAVTPKIWAYAGTAGSFSISYGNTPANFSTGITVCASSTGPLTKTAYSTNTVFSGRVQ